jgi:hypothetical protein
VNCGPQSNSFTLLLPFYFTRFIYILANHYLLPLDTLNPLFIAKRWDWQPHCKLGQSTWLCCVQVPPCCWWKATRWQVPGAIVQSVAKLAGINLRKCGSFFYWFDKPWFHNWGKLAVVLIITLLLGFSNKFSGVNYAPAKQQSVIFMHLNLMVTWS